MKHWLVCMMGGALFGSGALLAGCGDDDESPTDAAVDAGGDAAGDAAAAQAFLRVAHLSPDAPAVDFCIAPHGTTDFTGPVLKGLANSSGLSYPEVTQYVPVAPKQYDVRLVAPAAADCATKLTGTQDTTDLPELGEGDHATVAAIGEVATGAAQAFRLKAFQDEDTAAANKIKVRFLHASPGTGNVDVGVVANSTFTPLFGDVAYGEVESGSGFTNGYLESDPLSSSTLSVRTAGTTTEALKLENVTIEGGRVVTVFAIGKLNEAQKPLKALVCQDNAAPAGGKTVCATAP